MPRFRATVRATTYDRHPEDLDLSLIEDWLHRVSRHITRHLSRPQIEITPDHRIVIEADEVDGASLYRKLNNSCHELTTIHPTPVPAAAPGGYPRTSYMYIPPEEWIAVDRVWVLKCPYSKLKMTPEEFQEIPEEHSRYLTYHHLTDTVHCHTEGMVYTEDTRDRACCQSWLVERRGRLRVFLYFLVEDRPCIRISVEVSEQIVAVEEEEEAEARVD